MWTEKLILRSLIYVVSAVNILLIFWNLLYFFKISEFHLVSDRSQVSEVKVTTQ